MTKPLDEFNCDALKVYLVRSSNPTYRLLRRQVRAAYDTWNLEPPTLLKPYISTLPEDPTIWHRVCDDVRRLRHSEMRRRRYAKKVATKKRRRETRREYMADYMRKRREHMRVENDD